MHEQLLDTMRDFAMRVGRLMNDVMRTHGASLAQMKLLNYIQREKSVRSTDISYAFAQAPRTVTEAVDALERDGLVRRDPDPSDRRAKLISLTPAGEAVIQDVEPSKQAMTKKMFEILEPEEEAQLLALLDKLNGRLAELATVTPSEKTYMCQVSRK